MDGKRIRYGDRMKIPISTTVPSRDVRRNRAEFMGATGHDRRLPYAALLAVNLTTRLLMAGLVARET